MSAEARQVLDALQAAVDARDADTLDALFDDSAVLIGTGAEARDREAVRAYVTAVATQPGALRWEWREVVPFHETPDEIGFAAFGEVVLAAESGDEQRAPFRLTILAVRAGGAWRLRQFHGSIPASSQY